MDDVSHLLSDMVTLPGLCSTIRCMYINSVVYAERNVIQSSLLFSAAEASSGVLSSSLLARPSCSPRDSLLAGFLADYPAYIISSFTKRYFELQRYRYGVQ
jgi:hypothetical protein